MNSAARDATPFRRVRPETKAKLGFARFGRPTPIPYRDQPHTLPPGHSVSLLSLPSLTFVSLCPEPYHPIPPRRASAFPSLLPANSTCSSCSCSCCLFLAFKSIRNNDRSAAFSNRPGGLAAAGVHQIQSEGIKSPHHIKEGDQKDISVYLPPQSYKIPLSTHHRLLLLSFSSI